MLHVLLHMSRQEGPITSERLAHMLGTNPVVVRRTMAGLREAGYVRSEKGHGGGWVIQCDLERISLLDIHRAVGGPRVFAIGTEHARAACQLERTVNDAIEQALSDAEMRLVERLSAVSLAQLSCAFDQRMAGLAPAAIARSACL